MKKLPLFLIVLFAAVLLVSPGMAQQPDGRYSYIQVDSVDINVIDINKAEFEVNYTIDENVNFLVMLLGKNDLKQKLCQVLSLEDCHFDSVDLNRAHFTSYIQSYNNGDGTYWFPERVFKIEVPNVTIRAQDNYKIFDSVMEFPGIGYYYGPVNTTQQ